MKPFKHIWIKNLPFSEASLKRLDMAQVVVDVTTIDEEYQEVQLSFNVLGSSLQETLGYCLCIFIDWFNAIQDSMRKGNGRKTPIIVIASRVR